MSATLFLFCPYPSATCVPVTSIFVFRHPLRFDCVKCSFYSTMHSMMHAFPDSSWDSWVWFEFDKYGFPVFDLVPFRHRRRWRKREKRNHPHYEIGRFVSHSLWVYEPRMYPVSHERKRWQLLIKIIKPYEIIGQQSYIGAYRQCMELSQIEWSGVRKMVLNAVFISSVDTSNHRRYQTIRFRVCQIVYSVWMVKWSDGVHCFWPTNLHTNERKQHTHTNAHILGHWQ